MQGNYKPLRRAAAPIDAVLSGNVSMTAGTRKVMLSLRVPQELKTRFKAVCARDGLTMEQAGEQSLLEWLERMHA